MHNLKIKCNMWYKVYTHCKLGEVDSCPKLCRNNNERAEKMNPMSNFKIHTVKYNSKYRNIFIGQLIES